MSIIDFEKEHDKRHGPDPDHVIEIDGEKWLRFMVSFEIDGGVFVTDLWALDFDHADYMLDALKKTGTIQGQIYRSVDD